MDFALTEEDRAVGWEPVAAVEPTNVQLTEEDRAAGWEPMLEVRDRRSEVGLTNEDLAAGWEPISPISTQGPPPEPVQGYPEKKILPTTAGIPGIAQERLPDGMAGTLASEVGRQTVNTGSSVAAGFTRMGRGVLQLLGNVAIKWPEQAADALRSKWDLPQLPPSTARLTVEELGKPTRLEEWSAEQTEKTAREMSASGGIPLETAYRIAQGVGETFTTTAATLGMAGGLGKAEEGAQAAKTMWETVKQASPQAAKFSGLVYATTPGGQKERATAAAHAFALGVAGSVAGWIPSPVLRFAGAFAIDAGINTPGYIQAYEEAKRLAEQNGGTVAENLASTMTPQLLLDLTFAKVTPNLRAMQAQLKTALLDAAKQDRGRTTAVKPATELRESSEAREGVERAPVPEGEIAETTADTTRGNLPPTESLLNPQQHPVQEVPVSELNLSKDVPNFKADAASDTGIVRGQQLSGEYQRLGTAPIVVWERFDGRKEVITGRHRMDLAKRSGEETIPAQVVKESEGFTETMARVLDAESNIRDGTGKVKDYANYFRNAGVSEAEAEGRGLLARTKGRDGWTLGQDAGNDLYALYAQGRYTRTDGVEVEGKLSEQKALAIARAAPKDEKIQRVGIQYALSDETPTSQQVGDFLEAFQTQPVEAQAKQMDLFGVNDSAIRESIQMSKAAGRIRGRIERTLSVLRAGKKAAQFNEIAKANGIDVRDPQAILAAINERQAALENWDHWRTNVEKMRQVRQEAGLKVSPTQEAQFTTATASGRWSDYQVGNKLFDNGKMRVYDGSRNGKTIYETQLKIRGRWETVQYANTIEEAHQLTEQLPNANVPAHYSWIESARRSSWYPSAVEAGISATKRANTVATPVEPPPETLEINPIPEPIRMVAESGVTWGATPPEPIRNILETAGTDRTLTPRQQRKARALTEALQEERIDDAEAQRRWEEATTPRLPLGTVEGNAPEIGQLFDSVTSNTISGNEKRAVLFFREAGEHATKLNAATGQDLSGYSHTVDSFALRKVLKDHGTAATEISRGQEPITREDISKIPDIVENYDTVESRGQSKTGNEIIRYTKRYNGNTYYVEEVRTGRRELAMQTMWKTRSARKMPEGPPPTSETLARNLPPSSEVTLPRAGSSVKATFTAPGGELGGPLGEPGQPTDSPEFSVFPVELPEAVEFAQALGKGKFPKLVDQIRALGGSAAGVFKATPGLPESGRIEMRQDLFRRLTSTEEAQLRTEAAEYAQNNKLTVDQAKEYYQQIRDEALDMATKRGPVQALKVLWHEIGHWVDFLPDATLSRGNLLGHIASLKNWTKTLLTDYPDGPEMLLTPKERERRRRTAERQLKDELGPVREMVETIIREEPEFKQVGLSPEDIRAMFGTNAREDMPEAYMWFAGLDPAAKKDVVRSAMKGILDERAKGFSRSVLIGTRQIMEERRTIVGGPPSKEQIRTRFKQLIREEIERRRLIDVTTLKNELKPLIAWWRGTTEVEAYFKSPEEMYAEAFSVLMNNPAAVMERAPKFWRAFDNYADARPEVRDLYDQIQERIKTGGVNQNRRERVRTMFKDVDAEGLAAGEYSTELTKQEKRDRRRYTFDRIFGPMYERLAPKLAKGSAEEQRAAGKVQQAIDDFRYKAIEHERYLGRMNEDVSRNLVKNNLDWTDLGEYMLYKHITENRADIANPLGIDPATANRLLAEMRRNYGPNRFQALEQAQREWWANRNELVLDPLEAAGVLDPEMMKVLRERDFYATISAAITGKPTDTLETLLAKRYGANTGGKIFKQEGHLGKILNPATAMVAKDLSLITMAIRETAKREVVNWLAENDTTLDGKPMIAPAKTRWNGQAREPIEIENDRIGTIMFMQEGKLQAWYVPRTIADSFNVRYSLAESTMTRLMVSGNSVLKGLYTQWNYGFWPFNFLRDVRAFIHYVPGTSGIKKLREIPGAFRAAKSIAFGKEGATTEADLAMSRKMLGAHAEPMGYEQREGEFERQLQRFGISPATWNKEAVEPIGRIKRIWQNYLKIGTVLERTVKIAGMKYLDNNYTDMPEWKKREIVHEMAGSPDFWNKAKGNPVLDAIQLFYNARKEGYRSAIKSFKEHPGERMWKTAKYTLFPAMLMTALSRGMLSQLWKKQYGTDNEDLADFEDAYRYVPIYDMNNYEIVPMAWVDQTGTIRKIGKEHAGADKRGWKVLYIRMPLNQSEQLTHALTLKVMREGNAPAGANYLDALTFASGELPTGNPIWNTAMSLCLYYLNGVNPPDLRTGKPILSDDVAAARDHRAAIDLAKWTANQFGSIIGRFRQDRLDRENPTNIEKFLQMPVVGNLAGRFVKVSDRGLYDEVAQVEGNVTQDDARTRLDVQEAMRIERKTGKLPEWAQTEMRAKPYFATYYAQKRQQIELQKKLTPMERGVIQPKSTRTRQELLMQSR